MNRRKWITGLLAIIPLVTLGKAQESLDLIYCKPLPLEDEGNRYSIYNFDGRRFHGAEARAKYIELYMGRLEQFGRKAKEAGDLFTKTRLPKHEEEQKLWVDAVLCAGACLDDVRRLQKRYDRVEVMVK